MNYRIRPRRPRELRSYRRIANRDHGPCSMCNRPIVAGDEYEGYVMAFENRLWVQKYHLICPDDFWEEQAEFHNEAEKSQSEATTERKIAA